MNPPAPSNCENWSPHLNDCADGRKPPSDNPGEERLTPAADNRSVYARLMLLAAVVAIVYGDLYPFVFRIPPHDIGPVRALLDSWAEPPGRGDFLANILLFLPLGAFGFLSLPHPLHSGWRVLAIAASGAALSVSLELAQYFDETRFTEATDVYANSLGTILGAIFGLILRGRSRFKLFEQFRANPIPTVLIAIWCAYRLYPYVPTIDLHKYWIAVKALLISPSLGFYDVFRHAVIWLTLSEAIAAIAGERRAWILVCLFAAGVFSAKVVIVDAVLGPAEIVGAVVAFCLSPMLGSASRTRAAVIAALLFGYIMAMRLEPFTFLPFPRNFEWMPFGGLFRGSGSLVIDTLSFFEKTFLYGGLLFLLSETGMRLRLASSALAICLFLTSWIETYLPGRSAAITDAVIALLIACFFAILQPRKAE